MRPFIMLEVAPSRQFKITYIESICVWRQIDTMPSSSRKMPLTHKQLLIPLLPLAGFGKRKYLSRLILF